MESKTKLKRKWQEMPLFWQSQYEFVVSYDFEECIRRINMLEAKYSHERSSLWNFILAFSHLRLDSQQDNGGVFSFKMNGHMQKVMLDAQLNGQLIYKGENQTQVKVQVGFTASSAAFLIGLLAIICLFLIANGGEIPLLIAAICIYGFVSLMQLFFGYSLKLELYHDLREALQQPKVPRPMTLPR